MIKQTIGTLYRDYGTILDLHFPRLNYKVLLYLKPGHPVKL
jgi:hypothetical protein